LIGLRRVTLATPPREIDPYREFYYFFSQSNSQTWSRGSCYILYDAV